MPLYHDCPYCGGTGEVQLTGIYAETFTLLAREKDEVSGAALAKKAKCKATAMNNRLAKLEEHGYAISRRWGRVRLFKAKKIAPRFEIGSEYA